jgi:hypothetical protein
VVDLLLFKVWKISNGKIEVVFFVIKYGRKLTIGWKCQEMRQRKLFMLCPLSQVLWEYINVIPVIKVWIINRQNINQYTNVVNFDYRFWKRFSRKVWRCQRGIQKPKLKDRRYIKGNRKGTNNDLSINLIQPTISLEMPVPSQGHYGLHSFPVVDWFCLFI